MNTLRREFWNGQPEQLRERFVLTKPSGAHASLQEWTHPFGWELRLEIDGSLIRSQVTRDPRQIPAIADEWRTVMLAKGWQ